jgi:hypothetical protein
MRVTYLCVNENIDLAEIAKRLKKQAFQRRGIGLLGVDANPNIHRYDPDGWRLLPGALAELAS